MQILQKKMDSFQLSVFCLAQRWCTVMRCGCIFAWSKFCVCILYNTNLYKSHIYTIIVNTYLYTICIHSRYFQASNSHFDTHHQSILSTQEKKDKLFHGLPTSQINVNPTSHLSWSHVQSRNLQSRQCYSKWSLVVNFPNKRSMQLLGVEETPSPSLTNASPQDDGFQVRNLLGCHC